MIQKASIAKSPCGPGGLLRCAVKQRTSQSKARLDLGVAEDATRRLGILAVMTAVTVVGMAVLQHALQPEVAAAQVGPLFRLTALFLVLISIGLAVLQQSKLLEPQRLLDLGQVFQVVGALSIGIIESSLPWPDSPIRGSTGAAAWIALCILVIPNRPWKNITAALFSALMVPCAHLLCASVLGYPAMPWNRLAAYSLSPLFIAAWAPFLSTRIYRMQQDLGLAADLGSYRLESLLGKGGMGEVWRASHRLLRREAAVKLIRTDILSQSGAPRHARERFELEAQAIASLRSPHTVALYDFGTSDDGSLFYAMELLEGFDAQALVERHGPLPPGRVVSLLRQACDSLEEAHDAGMVHRDIKPNNLFVCRLGKQVDFVKVLDFGLVKAAINPGQAQLTQQGDTSGTPAFMSPEQVRGEEIDARADIYALGCVAYFLLTGALVFEESTPLATAVAHVQQAPIPPSRRSELPIPSSLERTIMACLEKDREQRPGSITELTALLDESGVRPWSQADAREWWSLHHPARSAGAAA